MIIQARWGGELGESRLWQQNPQRQKTPPHGNSLTLDIEQPTEDQTAYGQQLRSFASLRAMGPGYTLGA